MVEIKIETKVLTHTFNENGTKDDLIDYFNELLRRKQSYINNKGSQGVIIPYNILKESIIEVYEVE